MPMYNIIHVTYRLYLSHALIYLLTQSYTDQAIFGSLKTSITWVIYDKMLS